MTMGAWTLTNEGRSRISDGTLRSGDTYKIALFLSTSNIGASSTTYAGLTNEHSNANGYTTGGASTTISISGTTSVPWAYTAVSWTASGGSIVARFAVVYEVSGNVLAYALLDNTPADVTTTTGNSLQLNAGNVITMA